MPTKDLEDYRRFTKPAELHKAVNTLRGLVAGINSDMEVGSKEVTELVHWCEIHAEFRDRHPFSEILPVVERATEDGVVTEEERSQSWSIGVRFTLNSVTAILSLKFCLW